MPPILPAPITAKRLCDRGLVIGRVFLGRLPLRSIADPIRIAFASEDRGVKVPKTSLWVWRAANWFRSQRAARQPIASSNPHPHASSEAETQSFLTAGISIRHADFTAKRCSYHLRAIQHRISCVAIRRGFILFDAAQSFYSWTRRYAYAA